jgi:hypothetical protein
VLDDEPAQWRFQKRVIAIPKVSAMRLTEHHVPHVAGNGRRPLDSSILFALAGLSFPAAH